MAALLPSIYSEDEENNINNESEEEDDDDDEVNHDFSFGGILVGARPINSHYI